MNLFSSFVFTCYITDICLCQSCQSAWHCMLWCSMIYLAKLLLIDSNYFFFTTTTTGAVNIFIYIFLGTHASISLWLIPNAIPGSNMHIYILLDYYQITLKSLCFFTFPSTILYIIKVSIKYFIVDPRQSCSSSVINQSYSQECSSES